MGRIQSISSFSTLDGPGARCVVFFQGCPMKCVFCHNPDSWDVELGHAIETQELMRRLEEYRRFFNSPALTISGGEPLWQPEFALELAHMARQKGWHVALDTSGWGPSHAFVSVCKAVDLVMFSIKPVFDRPGISYINESEMGENLECLARLGVPVWLRYVLIPDKTDSHELLVDLGIRARALPNLKKIQILPFNHLAGEKWRMLGKSNPLFEGSIRSLSEEELRKAEELVKSIAGEWKDWGKFHKLS
jgi:pyruvate formate lyase activating enzyme